jgi:hypothetical protein
MTKELYDYQKIMIYEWQIKILRFICFCLIAALVIMFVQYYFDAVETGRTITYGAKPSSEQIIHKILGG